MKNWLHAPPHHLVEPGTYMATGGTYLKRPFLGTPDRLQLVHDRLHALAQDFGWELQAWAVLRNHCHFVAISPEHPDSLVPLLKELHRSTSRELNRMDGTLGRRVWYQYWDKELTYQRSYLARLNYMHTNPVHHGAVRDATQYPWCSAAWFEREASPAFFKVVTSFPTDRLTEYDDF